MVLFPISPFWILCFIFGLGASLYALEFKVFQLPLPSYWIKYFKPAGATFMIIAVALLILLAFISGKAHRT